MVVEQRPEIYPHASRHEDHVYDFQVFHHIVRRVQEKACGNTVPGA